jgi:hypothetical protein
VKVTDADEGPREIRQLWPIDGSTCKVGDIELTFYAGAWCKHETLVNYGPKTDF